MSDYRARPLFGVDCGIGPGAVCAISEDKSERPSQRFWVFNLQKHEFWRSELVPCFDENMSSFLRESDKMLGEDDALR